MRSKIVEKRIFYDPVNNLAVSKTFIIIDVKFLEGTIYGAVWCVCCCFVGFLSWLGVSMGFSKLRKGMRRLFTASCASTKCANVVALGRPSS